MKENESSLKGHMEDGSGSDQRFERMDGQFERSKRNPILVPNPDREWENLKVYNPGAVFHDGKHHLFYRAVNRGEDWRSTIGHAVSEDGECFERLPDPAIVPEGDAELRGCEDPRVTKVGDTFFMAYASYDGKDVRLSIATSKDLIHWEKHGNALRDFDFTEYGGIKTSWRDGKPYVKDASGKERSKSGGIFPEKIDGKYRMIFGEYQMWSATSEDGLKWDVRKEVFLDSREGEYFDNVFVEMGPPPIKTEKGWLVLYHGVNEEHVYRIGFLLLDLDDPEKILYRSSVPIFEPKESYELGGIIDVLPGGLPEMQKMSKEELEHFLARAEKEGFMPKVTFCPGAVVQDGKLRIYYGAGDTSICTAEASLEDILTLADNVPEK
jgi:predicted GH43/DUF377 family glycosyl hydrolase